MLETETSPLAAPWKAGTLDIHSNLHFPPGGEAAKAVLVSVYGTAGPQEQQHAAQLFFVLSNARHLKYAGSCQLSETDETEASCSGSPRKVRMLGVQYSLLFPSLGRSHELGASSQLCGTVLEGETMVSGCHKISYQFDCSWFQACLEYKSLLTGFQIFHEGKPFMYCCWIAVSLVVPRHWLSMLRVPGPCHDCAIWNPYNGQSFTLELPIVLAKTVRSSWHSPPSVFHRIDCQYISSLQLCLSICFLKSSTNKQIWDQFHCSAS